MVAFVGGLSIAGAITGGSAALTTMPAWITIACGACMLCAVAWRRYERDVAVELCSTDRSRSVRGRGSSTARPLHAALMGIAAGLLLPAHAPSATGPVQTRSPGLLGHTDLFTVLERLDEDPREVINQRVSVTGEWEAQSAGRAATVSRTVMSCCAADVIRVGFDVALRRAQKLSSHAWVRVSGIVRVHMYDGDTRYVLEDSSITALEESRTDAH